MQMRKFEGAYTALVTPFLDGGALDLPSLDNLVRLQLDNGIDGLVPCGTTGEAATLSPEEHVEVVKRVVKAVNGKVPVIAGVGSPSTQRSVELARACAQAGADGLLAVTPYYVKPNAPGLFNHFSTLAQATSLPVFLYNVPGRTGVDMPADVVTRLATQVPNVVALKDASANLQRLHEMTLAVPDRFSIFSGEDGLVLPTLAVGGVGVISVVTNIPAVAQAMSRLCKVFKAGALAEARLLAGTTLPYARLMFTDTSPIPVKVTLAAMGLIREEWRQPLGPMVLEKRAALLTELRRLGVELTHA
jgi:4-hydroxy-tetrahydrodipicolinate synthase